MGGAGYCVHFLLFHRVRSSVHGLCLCYFLCYPSMPLSEQRASHAHPVVYRHSLRVCERVCGVCAPKGTLSCPFLCCWGPPGPRSSLAGQLSPQLWPPGCAGAFMFHGCPTRPRPQQCRTPRCVRAHVEHGGFRCCSQIHHFVSLRRVSGRRALLYGGVKMMAIWRLI